MAKKISARTLSNLKKKVAVSVGTQTFERLNPTMKSSTTTVKKLLESRGIVDPRKVIEKSASKSGFDINQTIDDFMSASIKKDPKLIDYYVNPEMATISQILPQRGGLVATVAVMAVAVAVVAVAAAAIYDDLRQNLLTEVLSNNPDVRWISNEVNQLIR